MPPVTVDDHPEAILERLGLVLPPPPPPIASYRPWTREGALLFISGQVSTGPAGDATGTLGDGATLEEGVAAARLCGLNLLSQIKAALDDLGKVQCVLKLTGFVKAHPASPSFPR
ncbi:MAG TPA: RidA family protein [Sphingomicrobium sp.]|nr:RidA family protein [Sphingomicrobium sp.]